MKPIVKQYTYKKSSNIFRRIVSIIFEYKNDNPEKNDPSSWSYELILDFIGTDEKFTRTHESEIHPKMLKRDGDQYQWVFYSKRNKEKKKGHTGQTNIFFKVEDKTIVAEHKIFPLGLNEKNKKTPTQKEVMVIDYTYRPGYKNDPNVPVRTVSKKDPKEQLYFASAPDVLDFRSSDSILSTFGEEDFRKEIVATLKEVIDLGANTKYPSRANAYLDMVTWDNTNRPVFKGSKDSKQSSCGMLIRNIWWLCGARGTHLMHEVYHDNKVITHLIDLAEGTTIPTYGNFRYKFCPNIGDAIYIHHHTKSPKQHIFTVTEIDCYYKTEDVKGRNSVRVYDKGTDKPAKKLMLKSIDGGQGDDDGWGCHGIQERTRTITLKDGFFTPITYSYVDNEGITQTTQLVYFDKDHRPITTWINIGKIKDKFTDKRIVPVRLSSGKIDK